MAKMAKANTPIETVKETLIDTPIETVKETNNDGFIKGQEVSEKDYFKFISEQRNKK